MHTHPSFPSPPSADRDSSSLPRRYPRSKWHSAARIGLDPAAGADNVTFAPWEGIQPAVERCPPGGSVLLLLPGTQNKPLTLAAGKEVQVFRRWLATAAGGDERGGHGLTHRQVAAGGLLLRRGD